MNKPVVVVFGILGRSPFAGVAWQVLHYLEGLRSVGCDVYYIEDTGGGEWPYDADRNTITDDCSFTVSYISRILSWAGFQNRWGYRAGTDGRIYGISDTALKNLLDRADMLINLTGATILREEHIRIPRRVYLETDPFLRQIEVSMGDEFTIGILHAHTHHFTFGENIGTSLCPVPTGEFRYYHTRQPVVMDWWLSDSAKSDFEIRNCFTTVSSWKQSEKDIEWNGEKYFWSKHLEFLKFVDLPMHTNQTFKIALAGQDDHIVSSLQSHRWQVADAISLSKDIEPYRDYIVSSKGEWTVAKDQYVRPRTGWFSDRSACYLAAGKPVITQDTGFGDILPTGRGLFAFRTMEEILDAVERINTDYELHSKSALEISNEFFAAEKVIHRMLEDVGLH